MHSYASLAVVQLRNTERNLRHVVRGLQPVDVESRQEERIIAKLLSYFAAAKRLAVDSRNIEEGPKREPFLRQSLEQLAHFDNTLLLVSVLGAADVAQISAETSVTRDYLHQAIKEV